MSDEKNYQRVIDELNGKPRKYTDKAIWTKAEFLSKGDAQKTRYKYIELRVKKLNEQEEMRAEKVLQKEMEKKEREREKKELFQANLIRKEREQKEKEEEIAINNLKQMQLQDQKELEESNSIVFWVTIFAAFIGGRLFGVIGVGSVILGYLAYKFAAQEYPLLVSILSGLVVTIVSYFIGVVIFVFGLETLL